MFLPILLCRWGGRVQPFGGSVTSIGSSSKASNPSLVDKSNQQQYDVSLAKRLHGTYCIDKASAEAIATFAKEFCGSFENVKKTSVRDKVHGLVARVLRHLGIKNEARTMQANGKLLDDLAGLRKLVCENMDQVNEMIKKDSTLEQGLCWVLSPRLMALAGGKDLAGLRNLVNENMDQVNEMIKKDSTLEQDLCWVLSPRLMALAGGKDLAELRNLVNENMDQVNEMIKKDSTLEQDLCWVLSPRLMALAGGKDLAELKSWVAENIDKVNEMIKDDLSLEQDLYWVLSPELMAASGGDTKNIFNTIKNDNHFLKDSFNVSKEEIGGIIEKKLAKESTATDSFDKNNQIIIDAARGYGITFMLPSGKSVPVENYLLVDGDKRRSEILGSLKGKLASLQGEDAVYAKKIEDFFKKFPMQGVLSAVYPNKPGVTIFGGGKPTITINFSKDVSVSVKVKTESRLPIVTMIGNCDVQIPRHVECEFSFDYDMNSGSGKNVKIDQFELTHDMDKIFLMDNETSEVYQKRPNNP